MKALFGFNILGDLRRLLNVKKRGNEDIADLKRQIISISLECGILSEFTSFVGVSETVVSHPQPSEIYSPQVFSSAAPLRGSRPPSSLNCCSAKGYSSSLKKKGSAKALGSSKQQVIFSSDSDETSPPLISIKGGFDLSRSAARPQASPQMKRSAKAPGSSKQNVRSLHDVIFSSDSAEMSQPRMKAPKSSNQKAFLSSDEEFSDKAFETSQRLKSASVVKSEVLFETPKKSSLPVLSTIVNSQKSAGYWESKDYLSSLLRSGFKIVLSAFIDTSSFSSADIVKIECTVIALSVLRVKESGTHKSWKLIESKALQFLRSLNLSFDWNSLIDSIQIE